MKGKKRILLLTLGLLMALSLSPVLAEAVPLPAEEPFLLQEETFGPLHVGMPFAELAEVPCAWEALGEPELWGADGLEHWQVSCAESGLTLGLARNPGGEAGAFVHSFTASAPCEWKTLRGIGIGDPAESLMSLYADDLDPEWQATGDAQWVLIGTPYGGILANVEEGLIVSLFFGAMAD